MTQQGRRFIGKRRREVDSLEKEYRLLAEEDEVVGRFLLSSGHYKHAVYWFVQAMEKFICSKVYQIGQDDDKELREGTKDHRMDKLLELFVERCTPRDDTVREHVLQQLSEHVLGGIMFGGLHNSLRYPEFDRAGKSFTIREVNADDANFAYDKLQTLKEFLQQMHKLW
jgi:hypothetical protein